MEEAIELTNEYARTPDCGNCGLYAGGRTCGECGLRFLGIALSGKWGDYASGTNHTLPTNGYAKAYSGVSLDSFIRKTCVPGNPPGRYEEYRSCY